MRGFSVALISKGKSSQNLWILQKVVPLKGSKKEIVEMILKYKAVVPGNKGFLREYEIKSSTKLYKLHEYLRFDLGFAPDQMVLFEALDADGVLCSEYGLFDMGDGSMDSVSLEKTLERGETVLNYVFDLNHGRFIQLVYVAQVDETPWASYPRTVLEKGLAPSQFAAESEDLGDLPEVESVFESDAAASDED